MCTAVPDGGINGTGMGTILADEEIKRLIKYRFFCNMNIFLTGMDKRYQLLIAFRMTSEWHTDKVNILPVFKYVPVDDRNGTGTFF